MTTQFVGDEGEPLFPMPPLTEQALRVAVMSLDPAAAVRFENEFHAAWQEALQTDCTVPMHTFLHRWGVFVAARRHPERAARLAELERRVGAADDRATAREAAAEIAALLDKAAREVVVRERLGLGVPPERRAGRRRARPRDQGRRRAAHPASRRRGELKYIGATQVENANDSPVRDHAEGRLIVWYLEQRRMEVVFVVRIQYWPPEV